MESGTVRDHAFFLIMGAFFVFFSEEAFALSVFEPPPFPSSLVAPEPIDSACILSSGNLYQLDLCRNDVESGRLKFDNYRKRIKRYCDDVTAFDGRVRNMAKNGEINWGEYDNSLKSQIQEVIKKCDIDVGDFYETYRELFQSYKDAMRKHDKKRDEIINRPPEL